MFDIDKQYLECQAVIVKTKTDWNKFRKEYLDSMGLKGLDRKNAGITLDTVIPELQTGKRHFSTSEDYNKIVEYYQNNREKFDTYTIEMPKENTVEARNNEILDIQWAVLTNRDTLPKLFNPGSFDSLKQQARVIRALKEIKDSKYEELSKMSIDELDNILSSKGHNITDIESQIYYYEQNSIAAKMIGIFANNNVSHAFLSLQDIHFKGISFNFDGLSVNDVSNNKLDGIKDLNGNYISKNIASYLAASVDAVKDPVLNFINSNPVTVNAAMVLLRLGFSPEAVNMFTSQPILKDLVRKYNNRQDSGYINIDSLIDEILKERGDSYDSIKALKSTYFTKEELAKEIASDNINSEYQTRVLALFKILTQIGSDLNELTFITKFNSSTNGVGPTIADTLLLKNRVDKFFRNFHAGRKGENISIFSDNTENVIENSLILKGFYNGSMEASEKVFKDYFPQYSLEFLNLLDVFSRTHKNKLNSEVINLMVNDYMLYKMTGGKNPVFDFSLDNRKALINNISDIYRNLHKKYPDNKFLNILSINPSNEMSKNILEARVGGYSQDMITEIQNDYSELFNDSPEEANKLFYYSIIRSGFKFSPTNYSQLSSIDIKKAIPGYIEQLSNFNTSKLYFSPTDFMFQFMRNHSNMYNVVPVLNKSQVSGMVNVNSPNGKSVIFTLKDIDDIKVNSSFIPIITYKNKLYAYEDKIGSNKVQYREIKPLGFPNRFVEYDINEGGLDIESALNNTMAVSVKEDISKATGKREFNPDSSGYKLDSLTSDDINYIMAQVFTEEERRDVGGIFESSLSTEEKEMRVVTYALRKAVDHLNEDNKSSINYDVNVLNEILDKSNVCK